MAKQLERTFGGLRLAQGADDTSWLRDGWELAPRDFVFVGKAHQDSRTGLIHTLPAEGDELWTSTFCVSETEGEVRRRIISANMGYLATSPLVVNIGYKAEGGAMVADELKGVEMVEFGHTTTLDGLIKLHTERIDIIPGINPDISTETLSQLYNDLVYKSPRFP